MAKEGLSPVNSGDMKITGNHNEGDLVAQMGEPKSDNRKRNLARFLPWSKEHFLQERSRIANIREGVPTSDDAYRILRWSSDPETRSHLVPPPRIPLDWRDGREVGRREQELIDSYEEGYEKGDTTPLIAVNPRGEAIATLTLRWKNDKYLRLDGKTAVVERQMTDPELQSKGVGRQLHLEAAYYAFVKRNKERMILWTMTDVPGWDKTYKFFRGLGYKIDRGPYRHYEDLVRERGFAEARPEALLLSLRKEDAEDLLRGFLATRKIDTAVLLKEQPAEDAESDETEVVAPPDRNEPEETITPQTA